MFGAPVPEAVNSHDAALDDIARTLFAIAFPVPEIQRPNVFTIRTEAEGELLRLVGRYSVAANGGALPVFFNGEITCDGYQLHVSASGNALAADADWNGPPLERAQRLLLAHGAAQAAEAGRPLGQVA